MARKKKFTFFQWLHGQDFVRWGWRFILRNSMLFILAGVIVLVVVYHKILSARIGLDGGYFSSPRLTTMSELVWFFIGGFLYLGFAGIKRLFKKKRGKR